MAIDGSFHLQFEFERFLSRCPKLAHQTQFSHLLKKGDMLTEEEVVSGVAELFLHPNYTIPLVGCFRAIAQKIVDRTVELLRLVPDLSLNSDDSMVEFDEDKFLGETESSDNQELLFGIDIYVRNGRGLSLHELGCLAFSRALDLVPFLLGSVLNYFKFAPPPFQRIMLRELVSSPTAMVGNNLLMVVRVSYRLLLAEPEAFTVLWDWSTLVGLEKQFSNVKLCDDAEFLRNVLDIRWCATQILAVVMKISDRATANFGLDAEEAFACFLRWNEFLRDVSSEKAGWYSQLFEGNESAAISSSIFQEIEPLFGSSRPLTWGRTSMGNPFVLTATFRRSFKMVLLAVSQRWPVLLYGPAGAGKTALISKLARDYGSRVLSIHMDEQIDGKTLIGSYVCTEQPGEFRWQPGSLTQAVLKGFWVVFEDIDKALADVQSILLPLLEGATSFFTGNGEAIRVAEGFRLFSTVSSSKLDISRATEGKSMLGALWRRVVIGPSSSKDLLDVVNVWYPDLEPLGEKLIETFERVNQLAGFHYGTLSSLGRFSLRDLLKWCKRIAGLGFCFSGDSLSSYVRHSIYQEAVDIFAAFSTSAENRMLITKEMAKIWSVPISAAETLYPVDRPLIQELRSELRIGRVTLQRTQTGFRHQKKPFVEVRSSLHVLERTACSVKCNEPVLLVGETGTGKTTVVQNLSMRLAQKLTVLNMSQQSDVADLLGGYKPMDTQFVCIPLYMEFENLFTSTFPIKDNEEFLAHLKKYVSDKNWKGLLSGFRRGVKRSEKLQHSGLGTKRKRPLSEELQKAWGLFRLKLETASLQIGASAGMIFSFVEGAFVNALKNGEWILLDEVNLAPPETLQRVIGVLEEESGSLCLAERGDIEYIHRHPNFRIFACMNPATDAGKRDLPFSIRSRFTEYFVDDVMNDEDLILFVNQFMDDSRSNQELVSNIVRFYKLAKKESEDKLQDGANQKPQYSLRSIYRVLEYTKKARKRFEFKRALYDGFCMFFRTSLDESSAKLMKQLILTIIPGGSVPPHVSFDDYLIDWKKTGATNDFLDSYVLTPSVRDHLCNLARAIFIGRYPVLLQGPTSSGKTSLVQFLAATTGREFVRINNHEHTDLQEYLGSYITDSSGRLVFNEGILVKAVRNGYWIVLDELNLAPSDVLEALNRLLDDNRELFVPELRETVPAHPDFMLFATQNPPTLYGGRKMLSRAFRNRFVEIHVDEIPQDELSEILEKRCKVPESYAKKMVAVMKELQLHRQSSKVFAGKHGFITPRDLFRWADRFRTFGKSYEDLARDGYYLLAERLRNDGEKRVVQDVLEKQLRVNLAKDDMYKQGPGGAHWGLHLCKLAGVPENLGNIIWTRSMWKVYFLVELCYKMREPVLLVGETGGGKTTVCQLLSICLGSKLHILNCHQYTETSDFLGGFYPVRERSRLSSEYKYLCEEMMQLQALIYFPGDAKISSDITQASYTLNQLGVVLDKYRRGVVSHPNVTLQELDTMDQMCHNLLQLHQKWQTIFMWQDGPLVKAMKDGDLFLVDEIALADDSVLERLNSVLEPERKLSLAEKGGTDLEKIIAHPNFFLLATMNPGGDYGKKELSPALRNRFTEIWVPPVTDTIELKSIAQERIIDSELSYIVDLMLHFWEWFNQLQTGRMLTVRDLLSWVDFIRVTKSSLLPEYAFLHGAFLVLLDGLSLGTGISKSDAADLRRKCLSFLQEELKECNPSLNCSNLSVMSFGSEDIGETADSNSCSAMPSESLFGIHPFYIEKGDDLFEDKGFEFLAPTTRRNALRVLRAMQLPKPVLLEGSPGVGKTSLIVALGKYSGHTVVRINLSEQTDLMDLLGSDLPVESDEGMQFAWSDGILLQALKMGSWVLLDELNLAPQSVLEGLNAILDHRAEVFIPELGVTYKCPPSFRVFACQNPSNQGGGRKGLPKSFLNRFTKVYIEELVEDDYLFICSSLYPSISRPILSKLILFNKRLHEDTMLHHKFGQDGSPWEFNLRDVIRSCQIIQGASGKSQLDQFLNTVYVQRMRTSADRQEVIKLYEQVFGEKPLLNLNPRVQLNPRYLVVGSTYISRHHSQSLRESSGELKILPAQRFSLEAVAHCVQKQWLCILVGPSSSGKTSLIRLLAQLTGNVLNELSLSSTADISELLGCFEQYDAFRNYRLAIARIQCYINEYCNLQMESSSEAFTRREGLITRWLSFLSSIGYGFSTSSTYDESWRTRSFNHVSLLVEIIKCLRLHREKDILPVSWSSVDLDKTLITVRKLQDDHNRRRSSAKFEWVTGLLIKAIENGEWIVLENANLCNPTVLDRINSLVEQSGSITVNECGTVDGKPVVLHPHPQFRMFLTVNPTYGEVSRAMRNRGVEICMMEPYLLLDEARTETELKDVKRFLVLSGIPVSEFIDSMANAHIYARDEGLHLGVTITYLELARWVQLFQRLLTCGNQPVWSLQISWEHTYLSSLGEVEGKEYVDHVKVSYLSVVKLHKFDTSQRGSSCLPGGWPTPLKLRDYVLYSKETSVLQNCMYLEFLASQAASYSVGVALSWLPKEQALNASGGSLGTALVNLKILHSGMFPKASNDMFITCGGKTESDLARTREVMLIAANWIMEQATESDLQLYLLWFSWFASQLAPICQFFSTYVTSLERELKHPIWDCIHSCGHKLMTHHAVDLQTTPIPILSLGLVDLSLPDEMSKSCSELLENAINSVGLLRRSCQQWDVESAYEFIGKARYFVPVLRSLRRLEEEVLSLLVGSPSFDVLFRLYDDLLDDHISFWRALTSSQFEYLFISWHSVQKDVVKLQDFCPEVVKDFQEENKNLEEVSSWSFHSQKSLLWVHGGHPFVSSSADVCQKHFELLSLCEMFWRRRTISWDRAVADSPIDVAVSFMPELRFLAMQGVCISAYIMDKVDQDELNVIHQLEEIHQRLLRKYEYEKAKLEASFGATQQELLLADISACCVFSPHMLCQKPGFEIWVDTLPIVDETSFFLDMRILQELSKIYVLEDEELQLALSHLSGRLESTLSFSMNFSSRAPTVFLPHQKILWTLDAWSSVNGVSAKISSFVLEMWFRWHTSLWSHGPALAQNRLGLLVNAALFPDMIFQPVKTAAIDNILQSSTIRDYSVQRLKLSVASRNVWQSYPCVVNIHSFFLLAARSLFHQIILAHKKSFEADKFSAIKSLLAYAQENLITERDMNLMISLLASSSHHGLTSLIKSFVEPLIGDIYLKSSSTDPVYTVGCSWLRLGGLRYHLLICCDDLDPAVKYSLKYSQLMGKIGALELETEVRKECAHLAGCAPFREADKQRKMLLEKLEAERTRLHKKVVFRSDPGKFKKLKYECDEFVKLVTTSVCLAKDADSMNIEALTDHMQNWQETATCFIERLSSEYSGYLDIVQPVQVAIYEMKLGLSLVLSSAFCKEFVDRVDVDDIDIVLGTVYEFVRFPRGCASKAVSLMDESRQGKFSSSCIKFSTNISAIDINLLEKLVTLSRDVNTDKTVPDLQMKAVIHQNLLRRVAHSAAEDRFMDNDSFMLLDKIFEEFASSWVKMKVQLKTREDYEAQQYKFRPRAFKIENVIGIDISSLGKSISNESFEEWQELVSEEKPTEADEGHEILEEDWNFLQDSLVNDMVNIHNALFGSEDLVQTCGSFQVSDADRLSSFIDSYTVGITIIRDLKGLSSSRLDTRLVPEHLLRLCLEHEEKFILSPKPEHAYNFYKDSNASLMVKLVEPVLAFQQRILRLLSEWDDHLALQKIMDVIEMILSIPLDTPLAKALSGLQFLLSRVRILQETVSKFPLNDLLEPIFLLVSSWQKLEFESWPALLDDVQAQFETNAGKLWFPLHSVLQRKNSVDIEDYNRSTIQSLEEFIKTSCVGEFRKRLQLLFAFHGQISTFISRECYSSACQKENVKILYNMSGFYVQLLPRVLGHIEAKRRSIEVELKELLKLCRWERSDMYMTMDISKRTRQKLRKLIQKYTDVLQQPVMLIVHQVAAQRGIKTQGVLGPPNLGHSFDQTQLSDNDRCIWWFSTWEKKVDFALQNLELGRTTQFDFPHNSFKDVKEGARIIRDCIASPSLFLTYQEEIKQIWYTIEKISGTAIEDAEVWDDENKSSGKRRPLCELLLSDLQNLLESSGLAKHRSTSLKENRWLLQPSYDLQHLLLQEGMSTGDADIAALDQLQRSHPRSPETEWKYVNGYHFKSIASLHRLLQIGLNFHKDFNPEQVNRSCSYIDHLIAIQQDQRAAAYDFAEKLKGLRACILPLESLLSSSNSLDSPNSSDYSFAQNQHVTYKCMWQQKQLFDSLCATLHDECLLLRTIEHNHLSTCESVAVEAKHLRLSLEKFGPDLQKSKELLDLYLLGHNKSITTLEVNLHQYGVTKRMEQLVHKNFLGIKEFEDHLSVLIKQDVHGVSISGALLGHFKDIFERGKLVAEEYYSGLQASCPSEMVDSSNHSRLQVRFDEALGAMYSRIVGVYCRVGSWSGCALSDKSFENIPVWKGRFDSNVADLQLDAIRDELMETTQSAGEMVGHNSYGNPSLCTLVGAHLKHLHSLLDPILTLSDSLLHDFLVISRKVSVMTHMLAEIFTSLYSHGFGISEEAQLDDTGRDKTLDAKGTGMGEGAGLNDVSDQITDEDQLLGTSEKPSEEQDVLNDAPSNNDKGIEMEQDFAAATFSVSEESGDDDDGDDDDGDGEDEQLESAMGQTGTNSEIVHERLWDKDDGDDEKPSSRNDKYESGPSVEDKDPSSRELRAKDETTSNADEAGEHDPNEIDTKNDDDNENSEGLDNTESMEGMNIDTEEAFSDPTGLKLDEPNRGSDEDISMDEPESVDPVEDVVPDENNNGPEENTTSSVDDVLNDMEPEEMERNSEQDDPKHKESITEMDSEGPKNDVFEPDTPPNGKSAPQPGCVSLASDFRDAAPESNWFNFNDTQNDLAPMSGLPNATDNEMLVADSSKGGKLSDEQPKTQLPQPDSSLLQKIQPNPCRNVGDALDGWRERAKVSVDLQDDNSVEAPVDVGDEDAGEYGFTSETDKGTAQALGPAASDQTDNKISEKKPDGEATTANREEHTEMEVEELPPDSRSVKSNAVNLGNKIEEQMQILNLEKCSEESLDVDLDHDREKMSDSFVSLRRSSMNEIHQLGKLSVSEDGIGKAQNLELLSGDMNANATSLWQRYELLTTRLSQELAEQLRLVMEPTLASKLQGDYKTGKRINMKKVISYIASHYRKDKIWLRRTRPNKRDYQVVIAVDDSRSMSESHCRDVAIEALVTVCRAMSQLEVGNLAVTSFGKKGNIRLLHDFDHPFNREAGVKMLSSLTFNQENTIADEPVGDLLKYLNIMLDAAAANARLPSGHNPLQQLVLIIADGLFHEKKENVKRCVRDILSKKCMVAFLLLDSPEKSIVDLEEVIFQGGKVKFPKYMDSFPFPFYAVVRNIEALPRTLADLLRQWFELMQYSRD